MTDGGGPGGGRRRIVFLFIGGPHQVAHAAPVAAALTGERPGWSVECLYDGDAARRQLDTVWRLTGRVVPSQAIRGPAWLRLFGRLFPWIAPKRRLLLAARAGLTGADAIVTPERTSARLRRMGFARTWMIHMRHGAGDSHAHPRALNWLPPPRPRNRVLGEAAEQSLGVR